MEIVIVTGLSGAGKSQAMKNLEDCGYYCVDNLPPLLIEQFIELYKEDLNTVGKIALGIDVRGGKFFQDLIVSLDHLKNKGLPNKVFFIEASDSELIKRYKETRRVHPIGSGKTLRECIDDERVILAEIKEIADFIIDTTDMGINRFRNEIKGIFNEGQESSKLSIIVNSFGFKKGIALDSDLVFDVRFLPNPFYIPELREMTGNDPAVQDYVMSFEESRVFFEKVSSLVSYLIPFYIREGKTQLIVSFGCTGGRHRSVTMANKLAELLEKSKQRTIVRHRDS